jgi:DNA-binding MarR family transcriptional regulator
VENPNITQSALARKLRIERSGLVAIVDDLEAKGYLKRTAVPGDRRVQALVPTQTGKTAHAEMVRTVKAHEAALLANMTAGEKQTLLELLKKIRSVGGEG